MTREFIFEKLTIIFRSVFKDSLLTLSEGMTANDIDNWDSLTHMILISQIENAFNIKFKLKELNKMNNIGALADLLMQKV
jgi:acyl carrier protein